MKYMLNIMDNFNQFYDNLTDGSRIVLYVIIVLLLIASMIFLIMIDQKKGQVKVVKNIGSKEPIKEIKEPTYIEEDIDNEKTRNLKEITQKIQEVMDGRNIGLTNFEQEQEENSIISYEELLKHAGQKKANYNEEKFELPSLINKIEVDDIIEKETPKLIPVKEEKFKKSDFISPIFGIQGKENNNSVNPVNLNTKSKIEEEEIEMLFPDQLPESRTTTEISNIKTAEDNFLDNLKSLRNNLN